MPASPKTKDLVKKLQDQLRPGGWHELLRMFLLSGDFSSIVESLEAMVADEIRFTPPIRQIFAPFAQCPLDAVKVVIVARAPHAQLGIADGLALSAMQPGVCPSELTRILDAIQQEFEQKVPGSPSLKRWAGQGVLLLNQSLTTQLDRQHSAAHEKLWNPFFMYLVDRLFAVKPQLHWVWYDMPEDIEEDFYQKSTRQYFPSGPQQLAGTLHLVNDGLVRDGQNPVLW